MTNPLQRGPRCKRVDNRASHENSLEETGNPVLRAGRKKQLMLCRPDSNVPRDPVSGPEHPYEAGRWNGAKG